MYNINYSKNFGPLFYRFDCIFTLNGIFNYSNNECVVFTVNNYEIFSENKILHSSSNNACTFNLININDLEWKFKFKHFSNNYLNYFKDFLFTQIVQINNDNIEVEI